MGKVREDAEKGRLFHGLIAKRSKLKAVFDIDHLCSVTNEGRLLHHLGVKHERDSRKRKPHGTCVTVHKVFRQI